LATDLETENTVAHDDAHRVFSTSILISATRCTLTYVVLPLLAPLVGWLSDVGPVLGLVIGTVAIVANIVSIRRFWSSQHPWRWPMMVLNASVIVLLVILLVVDLSDI